MRRQHLTHVSLWTLLAIGLGAVVGSAMIVFFVKTPYKGYPDESVIVRIPPRSSTMSILQALEKGGIIRDARIGYIALRVFHRGKTLKAGEYRFRGPRSAEQVVLTIAAGDVVTYRLTIPEGITAAEIFTVFSSQGFGSATEFKALFERPGEFPSIPPEAPTMEGFLFPETYVVTRSMTARDIVSMMTTQFVHRSGETFKKQAQKVSLSVLEAVTLASLIEEETSLETERPVISGVFHNRLKKGMLLQCDPTTIYALKRLGKWRGWLSRSDLTTSEIYNTYVFPGLPPGPICNPGMASLNAAVNPARTPHLYFVAKGDGTHMFAEDYAAQQRNVAAYREFQRAAREAKLVPEAEETPPPPVEIAN